MQQLVLDAQLGKKVCRESNHEDEQSAEMPVGNDRLHQEREDAEHQCRQSQQNEQDDDIQAQVDAGRAFDELHSDRGDATTHRPMQSTTTTAKSLERKNTRLGVGVASTISAILTRRSRQTSSAL